MNEFMEFLKNLGQRFNGLSAAEKSVALGAGALALAALFTLSLWVQKTDHQLLYANLSPEDASAVVEQLKTQNVSYQLSNQGQNIRVPSNQVHELRLSLAGQGLPQGAEVGFELFDDIPLGMTEFVQKLNFQRALQGELARTIKSLEAVEQARVHLVIPKEDLFLRDKPRGKASVMLKIRAGKSLSESQIQGIVHLVSSSVEKVEARDVVLLDLKGNMLSGAQGISDTALMTGSNYKHQKRVEQELENSITHMLEGALGVGKVIARVTADLNFDKVERTEEIYDPDSQVVRSEQNLTESSTGAIPPGGVPGVQSHLPQAEDGPTGGSGAPPSRSNEKQTLNYEINKTVRHIREMTGEIQKLSVSVLIDGVLTGNPPKYQARTTKEMAQFLEIIKTSVGFDAKRGDKIQLENVQFDKSMETLREAEMRQDQFFDWGTTAAGFIIGVILLVWFLLKILLPLVRWVTTSVEVVPAGLPTPSPEELLLDEEEQRIAQLSQENLEIRKSVNDFIGTDPKYAAAILRRWLRDRS